MFIQIKVVSPMYDLLNYHIKSLSAYYNGQYLTFIVRVFKVVIQ